MSHELDCTHNSKLITHNSKLEINPRVDRNGTRAGGAGDAAETSGIDVGIRVVPYRPVQHIDGVGADGERRSFS